MTLRENHICPHRGEEFRVVNYSGSTVTAADDLKGVPDLVRDRQLQTPRTESVNIAFSMGIAEFGPDGKRSINYSRMQAVLFISPRQMDARA